MAFCSKCGKKLEDGVTACPDCGAKLQSSNNGGGGAGQPVIVNIENANTNANVGYNPAQFKKEKNKWIAFFLCWFLGYLGAHKFYEGKIGMGILYLFTLGLFGIGWFIDFWVLLFKHNPYYV